MALEARGRSRVFLLLLTFALFAPLLYLFNESIPLSTTGQPFDASDSSNHAFAKLTRPDSSCASPYESLNHSWQQYHAQCTSLKTTTTEFEVQICEPIYTRPCNHFDVIVRRKSCSSIPAGETLASTEVDDLFIKTQMGPDTFHVAVSGNQLWATVTPYKYEDCSYHYAVDLSTGGDFKLQVSHMYEQYEGLAELWEEPGKEYVNAGKEYTLEPIDGKIPRWPNYIDKSLLPGEGLSSADMDLPLSARCPSSCPSYQFPATTSITRTRLAEAPRLLQPNHVQELPTCKSDSIYGTILPDPSPLHQLEKATTVNYRWQPIGCRLRSDVDLLLADIAELSVSEQKQRKACLANKKTIVLQGDSHLRYAFDALWPRLEGKGRLPVYSKAKQKSKQIGQFTLEFHWDPYLEGVRDHPADVVVYTAGAHQAAQNVITGKFSKLIVGLVSDVRQILRRSTASKPKVIYLTSPSRPPHKPDKSSPRDWRTNPRMSYWSALTRAIFQEELGKTIKVIDGFETTLPLYKSSTDSIHYHGLPVMESWLAQLLHHAELC